LRQGVQEFRKASADVTKEIGGDDDPPRAA
jgi:hypothetical protein